jgi:transposase-like protein
VDGDGLKKKLRRARLGGRDRYPPELRKAVVAYASRAKRDGRSGQKVAAELGMSSQTLQYWEAAARGRRTQQLDHEQHAAEGGERGQADGRPRHRHADGAEQGHLQHPEQVGVALHALAGVEDERAHCRRATVGRSES